MPEIINISILMSKVARSELLVFVSVDSFDHVHSMQLMSIKIENEYAMHGISMAYYCLSTF
jgi:hypothetical protein